MEPILVYSNKNANGCDETRLARPRLSVQSWVTNCTLGVTCTVIPVNTHVSRDHSLSLPQILPHVFIYQQYRYITLMSEQIKCLGSLDQLRSRSINSRFFFQLTVLRLEPFLLHFGERFCLIFSKFRQMRILLHQTCYVSQPNKESLSLKTVKH